MSSSHPKIVRCVQKPTNNQLHFEVGKYYTAKYEVGKWKVWEDISNGELFSAVVFKQCFVVFDKDVKTGRIHANDYPSRRT